MTINREYELVRALLAAAAWERVKGAMNELVAIQGQTYDLATDPGKYRLLLDLFEPVIKEIEDNELQL